jgi:hypothetical protein
LEMPDIPLHQDLKPAEALLPGLFHRLGVCPMIVSDPVAGDYHAGPIGAAAAVQKDRTKRRIVEDRQNLIYLTVRGREEAGHANPDIPHAGRFYSLFLPPLVIQDASKVEHRPNPAFRKV